MTQRLLIENCRHVATFDDAETEYRNVDILVEGTRIAAIGPRLREVMSLPPQTPFLDASSCLAIPGLVNTHHHFWQVLTRVRPMLQNSELFEWLVENYKVWQYVDYDAARIGAMLALSELLLSGCTTSSDHHYLFPVAAPAELLDAEFDAARALGIRLHATRGSMTLGVDRGGLPPMSLVESTDRVLADYERVIAKHHDTSEDAMTRIALAPCAPFNAEEALFRETVNVARRHGVLMHTHLAETADEDRYCIERFGCRPLDYVARLGWEGPDVWFAHCVMLNDEEVQRCARLGMGVAHCPSANARLGSGIAPVPAMTRAGVRVGLGVDGSSSNDSGNLLAEARLSFLLHRASKGVDAMTPRQALRLATRGGADILRNPLLGRLEVGGLADIVLIDVERFDLGGGASTDPVAGLILCGLSRPVDTVLVGGRIVVEHGQLSAHAEKTIVREANRITATLYDKARLAGSISVP